ncbi:hypothetical protein JY651_34110 [Pyxidicoccus parkwayensis]|uniref:Secreted protein n=1 Tax=Pyxidicoccus parkwayensis TaxID=2813578 RepID=A0ABX7NNC2_9BACT|nr:hypothetical protein [Pyxidicoccus parkwaysis]QSQ20270.1 hypothetical protein JY651_34110 [Pyxidicoccus parkwaysis]
MLRIWFCLYLLLFAPSVGGMLPSLPGTQEEVCSQRCADDDERGQCAPDCADCTCCGHVRSVAAPELMPSLGVDVERPPRFAYDEAMPPSVDVGDIQHVPIAALA